MKGDTPDETIEFIQSQLSDCLLLLFAAMYRGALHEIVVDNDLKDTLADWNMVVGKTESGTLMAEIHPKDSEISKFLPPSQVH